MGTEINFSKTEPIDDLLWACTIPNKGIKKDEKGELIIMPEPGNRIHGKYFIGFIDSIKTHGDKIELKVVATDGVPGVGVTYIMEES